MKFVLILLTALAGTIAHAADSGTNSGLCWGNLENYGYYYAYTDQSAKRSDGKIVSEEHSFAFGGFLTEATTGVIVHSSTDQIVYRWDTFELAVPYQKGAGLWFRDLSKIKYDRNGWPSGPGWLKLCDY